MINALIFDFDGLICDTETSLIDACEWMHQQAGLDFDRLVWTAAVGHDGHPANRWQAFAGLRDAASLDSELRLRKREFSAKQPTLPGVLKYLDTARQHGLRCAVASNAKHSHVDEHLDRLKIRHYFAAICCRDDVPRGKPEPFVYQEALIKLRVVATKALAFEDSPTGVLAAKRAGIKCIAVPSPLLHSHEYPHADLVLRSLQACSLEALLRYFNGGEVEGVCSADCGVPSS